MRAHEREPIVAAARADLFGTLTEWQERHDLTDVELLSVYGAALGSQINSVVKYMLRYERHGDGDTPGGTQ